LGMAHPGYCGGCFKPFRVCAGDRFADRGPKCDKEREHKYADCSHFASCQDYSCHPSSAIGEVHPIIEDALVLYWANIESNGLVWSFVGDDYLFV